MREKKIRPSADFTPPPVRHLGLITRLCLLAPPAFLLALKFDLPHILIFALVLIVGSSFLTHSLEMRERPVIYSTLLICIMAFLPGFIVKIQPSRLSFVDYLMNSYIFLPLMIYLAALMCWFRRKRAVAPIVLLIAMFAALICCDVYNTASMENTVFTGTTGLLRNYRKVYLVCVIFQGFGTFLLLTAQSRYDTGKPLRSLKWVRLTAFLLIPLLYCASSTAFFSSEHLFIRWRSYVRTFIQNRDSSRETSFPSRAKIMYPPEYNEPPQLLVEAIADSAPGYLRAKAYRYFSEYEGGVWIANEDADDEAMELDIEKDLSVLAFQLLPSWEKDTARAEIRFPVRFSGEIMPVPVNASSVLADAKSLSLSQEGSLIPENWNSTTGCICTLAPPQEVSAAQYPDGSRMVRGTDLFRSYLTIPSNMIQPFTKLGLSLIGNRNPESLPPRQRIQAVANHLLNNYSYTLDRDITTLRTAEYPNAVSSFLFYTKQGHCELFATASALLLRALGVPTRYVTGIVCTSYHPAGFYFATDRDLHAWTEAWLEDEQRWVMVETTPGSSIGEQAPRMQYSKTDVFLAKCRLKLSALSYWIRRGYPARVIYRAWIIVYSSAADFSRNHPAAMILILLAISGGIAGIILFLRRRAIRRYSVGMNQHRAMTLMLAKQRKISIQTGVFRKDSQPLQEWAESIGNDELMQTVQFYQSIRFSKDDCTDNAVHELRTRLKRLPDFKRIADAEKKQDDQ